MLSDEGKHVTQEEAAYARAKAEKVNSVFMEPRGLQQRGGESQQSRGGKVKRPSLAVWSMS